MAIYFSGNSNYELLPGVSVSGTTINAWADTRKNAGSGFWTANPQLVRIRIAGVDSDSYWTYDFRGATPKTLRAGSASRNVGYGTFVVEIWVNMASGIGVAYYSQVVTINNPTPPAAVPAAPRNLRVRAGTLTVDSFGVEYDRGSANGSAITQDHAEWSRADSGAVVWNDYGPGGYTSPNGGATQGAPALEPGVEYRVRVRSRNSVGWGSWSGYIAARTLAPAHVPKGSAFVRAAQIRLPKNGTFVNARQVRVPKNGAYVGAR